MGRMSIRTATHLDALLPPVGQRPRVFVETGTLHGKTTRWACARFPVVHTIELSPVLHAEAVRMLSPLGIHCHLGDSRERVPILADELMEPVVWFLDAHWTNVRHAAGRDIPLPLEAELRAIAARPFRDTVIVDDVLSFGREDYQAGWGRVSEAWIAGFFPDARVQQRFDCIVVDT
jgi:hypothetical protein